MNNKQKENNKINIFPFKINKEPKEKQKKEMIEKISKNIRYLNERELDLSAERNNRRISEGEGESD